MTNRLSLTAARHAPVLGQAVAGYTGSATNMRIFKERTLSTRQLRSRDDPSSARTCDENFEGTDALRPICPRYSRTVAARGNFRVVVCEGRSDVYGLTGSLTRSGRFSTERIMICINRRCSRPGCSRSMTECERRMLWKQPDGNSRLITRKTTNSGVYAGISRTVSSVWWQPLGPVKSSTSERSSTHSLRACNKTSETRSEARITKRHAVIQ
jgi:hypothetical protein